MDVTPDIIDDDRVEAAAREALGLSPDAPIAIPPAVRRMLRDSIVDEDRITDAGKSLLTRKEHQAFGNHGSTRELQIEKAGEVDVILDGSTKLITVKSAFRRRRRLIIQSHPASGPSPKGRDRTPPLRGRAGQATEAV